ncbi:MAG: hypothetical protein SGBAC_008235, partial [Bacillariaceae sp.]
MTNDATSADNKIQKDLAKLKGEMEKCSTLMKDGYSAENKELMDAIGFLEACAPRMKELVEKASTGALSAPVLEETTQLNDQLQKALAEVAEAAKGSAPVPKKEIDDMLVVETKPTLIPRMQFSYDSIPPTPATEPPLP